MKDILYYYYQIIIENNDIKNNMFSLNNHLFLLYKTTKNDIELEYLYKLNKQMIKNNIKINEIILTKYNKIYIIYNNEKYILIKIKYNNNEKFQYIKINNYNILKRNNYNILWENKINYIESKINYIKSNYKIIYKTIYYYINIATNALTYYNILNINEDLYITHNRINNNNLFNPIELVIDYKSRDFSEYIKYIYYNENETIENIINYIKNINLTHTEYILLYIRLLFPTYYFDKINEIINKKINEQEIIKITNKIDNYELLLYKIYKIIKEKYNIIEIPWINKNIEKI